MTVANTFTKSDYLNTLEWLITFFPSAFSKKPKEIKPLKIGILEEIYRFYDSLKNPEFSKQEIKQAIQHYSSSAPYLTCQTENQIRIDLFGQAVDVVNKEQAQYAYERLQQKLARKNQAAE